MAAREIPSSFFNQTVWAMGSTAVLALAGAILTFWLAAVSGREALGVFNQLYAIYIILGQLFAVGLNDSTLKHAAQYREDAPERDTVFKSALLCALATGIIGGIITFMLSGPITAVTDSASVGDGIRFIAPAVTLFVINKVLSNYVNGVQRMQYYAVTQSMRGVILVVLIIALSLYDAPMSAFGLAFIGAEAGVLLCFTPLLTRAFGAAIPAGGVSRWARRHFAFGIRALPHGLLTESFFRIDILVLAVFLSDKDVGLYSFVAFFIEGILQIPYIVRIVTTPHLIRIMDERRLDLLGRQALRSIPASLVTTVAASGFVLLVFPHLLTWFPLVADPRASEILGILLLGACVYAAFAPFESIFISGGRPDIQSLFMMIVTACNVTLNFVLIPQFGLAGAAAATAVTFAFSSVLLHPLALHTFGILGWRRTP